MITEEIPAVPAAPAPAQVYDRGQTDLVLACALNIARRIVECGGEIRRAEETVEFICHAYGIQQMEVFGILSEIQATIRTPDGRAVTLWLVVPLTPELLDFRLSADGAALWKRLAGRSAFPGWPG